jgi:ribosomal protein S15P/S13E
MQKGFFYALKKKEEIRKRFFILNEAKSGSLYEQNTIPNYVNKLTEKDILILQLLADWLQKYIKCTRKDKAKKFHLLKFEPVPQSKILVKYAHLKGILSQFKCKVLFIDNIYRIVR